jgi:hypothetical protein
VGNCVRDLCLIMLRFSWVLSRAFALDCVSLASLLLVFCFADARLASDVRLLVISRA